MATSIGSPRFRPSSTLPVSTGKPDNIGPELTVSGGNGTAELRLPSAQRFVDGVSRDFCYLHRLVLPGLAYLRPPGDRGVADPLG